MGQVLRGEEDPWLTLSVGDSNIIDSKPVRVTAHDSLSVEIECENGTISLDMASESARKRDDTGREWIYCGGLEEANAGLGWMPVS